MARQGTDPVDDNTNSQGLLSQLSKPEFSTNSSSHSDFLNSLLLQLQKSSLEASSMVGFVAGIGIHATTGELQKY